MTLIHGWNLKYNMWLHFNSIYYRIPEANSISIEFVTTLVTTYYIKVLSTLFSKVVYQIAIILFVSILLHNDDVLEMLNLFKLKRSVCTTRYNLRSRQKYLHI